MTEETVSTLNEQVHYRQVISPNYLTGSFVINDGDAHDFKIDPRGKSQVSVTIDNPGDKVLTAQIYGMHDIEDDVGDTGVMQIGSDITIATTDSEYVALGDPFPFYLVRVTSVAAATGNPTCTCYFTFQSSGGGAGLLKDSTFTGRVGEVQASPTANTLLARLKDLATLIGEIQASPTENTLLDRLKDLLTGIVLNTSTNAIGRTGHDITGIADNRKVVTTAGTAVALAASTPCKAVTVIAEEDNTGVIVVGGTTVVAALATRRGKPLDAGEPFVIAIDDLAKVYIDATVDGDGVTFVYLT